MKYTVNESVLACTPFGLRNATVLSARAEKQPAGNIAHIYGLAILGKDGKVEMEKDFDQCDIRPYNRKEDANLTHRKFNSILNSIECVVFESSRIAELEMWKDEVNWDETLTDEEKEKELKTLKKQIEKITAIANKERENLPKLYAEASSLLKRFLASYALIGHEVPTEILADLASLSVIDKCLAEKHAKDNESSAVNIYELNVPLRLSA